jgi:hypothetical protein
MLLGFNGCPKTLHLAKSLGFGKTQGIHSISIRAVLKKALHRTEMPEKPNFDYLPTPLERRL